MPKHTLAFSTGLLLGGLLLSGCTVSYGGGTTSAYANIVGPSLIHVLEESSGVESSWSRASGGSSSSFGGGSGWSHDSSWSGTFSCDSADLEALGENLFDGVRLDIFGAGFLIEDDEELTKMLPWVAGGSPAIQFDIEHYNAISRGTLAFKAFPKGAGKYSFSIDFTEEAH